jgi:gas vesicle protein
MVFDILSFIAGVAAGTVVGGLAGILHGLENTADLQERVRALTKQVEEVRTESSSSNPDLADRDMKLKMDEIKQDLDEIHEQIRRMYKRTR